MKRSRNRIFVRSIVIIAVVFAGLITLTGQSASAQCIDGLSSTLFNTTTNCSSQPEIDRIFGTQVMNWSGKNFLVGNIGNDLKIWNIQNPQSPTDVAESRFRVGNVGDSDYDMYNFSVCDGCRYGVANYKKGAVLFDMGTSSQPDFGEKTINSDSNQIPGAFTFKHGGQQYLIGSNLPNECSTGNSTLYEYNGIEAASDLSYVGCVEAGTTLTKIVGGFHIGNYLYLGDMTTKLFVFEIEEWGSTIVLNYISYPMTAYMIKDKALAVDIENNVAIQSTGTGMHVWDISNPASPAKVASVSGDFNRAAVKYPMAFVAKKGFKQSEKTFDISNLSSPQPLDQTFWGAGNEWNYPDHQCAEIQGATFSPDGSTLYVARYSVLQMADLTACAGPVSPTAGIGVSPEPQFPGGAVTVTNQSLGEVDRSAIWVTLGSNPDSTPVVGDSDLSGMTPSSRQFTIPQDIPLSDAFYAHVAVESDSYPYGGSSTPDQIDSQLISVDRAPKATVALFPASPITGDEVTVRVTADGVPSSPTGGDALEWTITPPTATPYQDTGSPITVDLNESGRWTVALVVHYEHETSGITPGPYDTFVNEDLDISSVFANFTYSPTSPLNTEAIFLDASSSNIAADASPSYAWQITGPTNYTSCPSGPSASTCTIPADTLEDGSYTFALTLTNTNNGDQSTTDQSVYVADGNLNPTISWNPTVPEIGEGVIFRIEGVSQSLDSATWNFGGSTCAGSGYTNPSTCVPNYTDCKAEGYMYATSGTKNVSLNIVSEGVSYGPYQTSLTVSSAGTCDGGGGGGGGTSCTYNVSPASSNHAATGGAGTISVATQTGCAWNAYASTGWISITSGSSGTSSGTVNFTVAANTGAERAGTVTAGGKNHMVTQAAAACAYELAAYEASFDAGGGTGSVQVISQSGCAWTAVAYDGWLTVSSGSTGSGTGYVHFAADPNPYAVQRVGTMVIAGNTFSVVQGPKVPTNFTISNSQPNIGETITFTVDSALTPVSWNFGETNCYDDNAFIDCSSRPAGYCNSIEWSYQQSTGKEITLVTTTGSLMKGLWVQPEGECCIADNEPDADFKMQPDPALVGDVVTFSDMSSFSKKAPSKIAVDAINFVWDPTAPEIGELVEFDISGVASIDIAKWEFHEDGCSGFSSTEICTPVYTNCTKTSFKFASGGEKTVTLTITANGSTYPALTKTITVLSSGSCSGGGGCSYGINPTSASYPKDGGSGTVAVTTQAGCAWTAASNATWANITSGASGTGPGSVSYTVTENTGAYRTAAIVAANKNHSITQAAGGAGGCTYTLSSPSGNYTSDGGVGSFQVTTEAGCAWTAASSHAWTTITGGSSGTGTGTVVYSVAANTGDARTAVITAGGRTHLVTQTADVSGFGNTDPTEWSWTISKSGNTIVTSHDEVFTHVFTQPGLYEVELVAGNCKGDSTAVQYLQVDRPPITVPDDYLVPAAIHAPGINNTMWKTDLRLFNPGNETVTANIEYLPEGINNNGGFLVGTDIVLGPKATWINEDIVDRFPVVIDGSAKGSLLITFEDDLGGQPVVTPVIMSRTYNQLPDGAGTFGQFVPAVPVVPSLTGEIYLTGLVENLYYRTNIGLANMGPDDAWVLMTLLDQDGVAIGEITQPVPGYSTEMVIKAAVAAGIQVAVNTYSVRIETFGADISAYASVVDNVTGDPVLLTTYDLDDELVYVPGLAHLPGVNDSTWRSDMTFFNPTSDNLEVIVEYVPSEASTESPYMEFPGMPYGTAFPFIDVLGYLLGQSAESKGYFVVSGQNGSLVPQIAGRTYSQDATAGTFGQNLKVFCEKDLVDIGETAYIAGVSNSPDLESGFRTNLGLLNIDSESWSAVSITLYNEAGEVVAEIESMNLKEGEFKLENIFSRLGVDDVEMSGSIEVKVLSKGPVAVFASQIDNQTQDPILIPAQISIIE